jgi:hypothetical protein
MTLDTSMESNHRILLPSPLVGEGVFFLRPTPSREGL